MLLSLQRQGTDGLKISLKALHYSIATFPIASYIFTLYMIAITRISLGFLALINVCLIHPLVSIPFGMVTKPLSKKVVAKICTSYARLRRLATFSINLYFTFIAVIIACAFKIWILTLEESGLQSSFDLDFKNQGFDLCTCQLLEKFDLGCANNEANLQNYLDTLPIEILLYALILIPLCCHFRTSCVLFLFSTLPRSIVSAEPRGATCGTRVGWTRAQNLVRDDSSCFSDLRLPPN